MGAKGGQGWVHIMQSSEKHRLGVITTFSIPALLFATCMIWSKLYSLSKLLCPNPSVRSNNSPFSYIYCKDNPCTTLDTVLAQIIIRPSRRDANQTKDADQVKSQIPSYYKVLEATQIYFSENINSVVENEWNTFSFVQYLNVQVKSGIVI